MKIAAAIGVLLLLIGAAVGGSYALSLHAIGESQRNWCSALTLLTRQPVPPPKNAKANPSREATYQFFLSLKDLERRFGC